MSLPATDPSPLLLAAAALQLPDALIHHSRKTPAHALGRVLPRDRIGANPARSGPRTDHKIRAQERRIYIDFSYGILKNQAGMVIGAMAVGRDCTERHLATRPS